MNPLAYPVDAPVAAFAALGYALLLLTFILLTVGYCTRTVGFLYVRYDRQGGGEWWDGPAGIGVVPPAGWTLRAASVPFVLAWTAWAFGALVYLLVGGGF